MQTTAHVRTAPFHKLKDFEASILFCPTMACSFQLSAKQYLQIMAICIDGGRGGAEEVTGPDSLV